MSVSSLTGSREVRIRAFIVAVLGLAGDSCFRVGWEGGGEVILESCYVLRTSQKKGAAGAEAAHAPRPPALEKMRPTRAPGGRGRVDDSEADST